MKSILLTLIMIPSLVFAQKVDVKDLETSDSENTTIEISKGKKKNSSEAIWEVADGSTDISGEPAVMLKEAKQSWKKACEDWKKEFRNDNKENKIISISCGKEDCGSDTSGRTCTSKATYKIKTKLN